jgi:Protein kinase domain
MVGQTVGKYRIVSRLGRGGMGTVYKAVDETLDREVAIKCLNAELGDTDLLKRFRAEAVTLARLNHPNIATLFELGDHDGQMMMVMEYVRGETFDRVSQREGQMAVTRAAQLCAQVLDALEHAHRAGVVHRDLKPANLMLTQSGLVKVMDFGLARMIGTEHLTNDGYMVGTPAYMAPEQVLGRDIDGRADLYAMGVVLFRLLTSQLPFTADSGIAMVQRQLHDSPTPVRQVRSELPEACEEILSRALEKIAGNRYQTADEFRSALTRLDPSLALTGVSRIASSVAPAVTDAAPQPAAGASPATIVLPREGGTPATRSGAGLPAAAPAAQGAAAPPRRPRLAPVAIAAGVVLLAGIPLTGVMWWRSRQPSSSAAAVALPAPSVTAAPSSVARASTVAAEMIPARPKPLADSKAAPGLPAAKKASLKSSVSTAAVAPEPARPDLPIAIFSRIKLLILGEEKPRDCDATLRLAADGFEVLDGSKALESAAWQDVIGLYYSHSKEPRWTNADGQSAPVARAGGGGLGFLKGTPDWITLRTRRNFVPLRVREDDVRRLTTEIEARTGATIVRVK